MKNQEGCSEGQQKAPIQPASPAFFEHHSQKTFCESIRLFCERCTGVQDCNRNSDESLKKNQAFLLWNIYKKNHKKVPFPKGIPAGIQHWIKKNGTI